MFGYVTANPSLLSEEDKVKYRAYYCGLCRKLKEKGKGISSISLNYDMAFLAIILDGVYNKSPEITKGSCGLHFIKGCSFSGSEFLSYAADMNIILMGHKLKDDIADDNSLIARGGFAVLGKEFEEISAAHKEKSEKIRRSLSKLYEIEKSGRLLPDECASCFGEVTGEIFRFSDDEHSDALYNFGYSLGKFIYILDACLDRDKDIKKKRFNPLIRFRKSEFRGMLNLLMADCLEKYERLGLEKNKSLVENIIFSGVWSKFEFRERKNK